MRAVLVIPVLLIITGCSTKDDERYDVCTFTATAGSEDACAPVRYVEPETIVDGDTFDHRPDWSLSEEGEDDPSNRIRILGIEAPDIATTSSEEGPTEAQCYAEEATDYLESLIGGRTLRLEFDEECVGYYGRTLAHPFIEAQRGDPLRDELERLDGMGIDEDGCINVLVSEVLVRAGYVRVWEPYDGKHADRLRQAERMAEDEGLGLWSACDTTSG